MVRSCPAHQKNLQAPVLHLAWSKVETNGQPNAASSVKTCLIPSYASTLSGEQASEQAASNSYLKHPNKQASQQASKRASSERTNKQASRQASKHLICKANLEGISKRASEHCVKRASNQTSEQAALPSKLQTSSSIRPVIDYEFFAREVGNLLRSVNHARQANLSARFEIACV